MASKAASRSRRCRSCSSRSALLAVNHVVAYNQPGRIVPVRMLLALRARRMKTACMTSSAKDGFRTCRSAAE